MGTVALALTGAVRRYGPRTVLDEVDLEIERGDRQVVLGPTGSGKSTLLRVLAGLEPLDGGTLHRPGDPVTATVFQEPLLLPWLTVRENVRLGGRYRANRSRFDDAHADALLDRFGMAGHAEARPAALSGGQAQRVAIARGMAVRPDVLLLDEPFGALDPATRAELQTWLRGFAQEEGLTLVLVTHDVDEALYLGTQVTALDGDGGIGGRWTPAASETPGGHPLRDEVLAGYRSQVVAAR
ncbi:MULTISPECIES: ABC transporter ATP-binding protein [Pseudonocardia]|uniref:Sulfate/thiosulfate import ATP-binding protein CysA n=2 Tax=Pseudonocardia TaxID=1847 RepID=A0A1Y2N973_PSEAH|nr:MULTISPECIES: ABC transporter ATP-binding protein [Pseudonocardia]OSY44026.1 Sulfate/thiosulfate import ATP-binding protein CysA [Pseudonocardia autotrophica]TDN74242.1 sulfate transport system ATP-binding protein/sulfonate transport system ATP-binding protein [Pseudonocardia autotrophica]BBG05005.1 nitrate ABC transporter ATP-binding protein [Pseudonocardia autotrophica]GEC28339.1 nitrate ABC transporter ATP-binding protein [Pseudonocardia saturnea]